MAILNPYYNMQSQGLLDRNGWYAPYANNPPDAAPDTVTAGAISPNVFAGYLNWKKDRFAATFSAQLNQGTPYGSPLAVVGIDPRTCQNNQQSTKRSTLGSGTGVNSTGGGRAVQLGARIVF